MSIGQKISRKLFESRGNNSELHLSEKEIANICDGTIDAFMEFNKIDQIRQLCMEQHEALQLFTGASMGGLSGKHALELIEKYTKVMGS